MLHPQGGESENMIKCEAGKPVTLTHSKKALKKKEKESEAKYKNKIKEPESNDRRAEFSSFSSNN